MRKSIESFKIKSNNIRRKINYKIWTKLKWRWNCYLLNVLNIHSTWCSSTENEAHLLYVITTTLFFYKPLLCYKALKEKTDRTTFVPSLWKIKDEEVYLLSNYQLWSIRLQLTVGFTIDYFAANTSI